eukprot:m.449253 g.449253  ORF g.449253 m.449253 type:complete len:193 (-) comp19791_c0_seq1:140-718(-)
MLGQRRSPPQFGIRSTASDQEHSPSEFELKAKLIEVIRQCRPEWCYPAVRDFAVKLNAQAEAEATSQQHYQTLLSERVMRLAHVAKRNATEPNRVAENSTGFSQPVSRRDSVQRCAGVLSHACRCRDDACNEPSCRKMKGVIQHSIECRIEAPHCDTCRQLAVLCRVHSADCRDGTDCPVPRCCGASDAMEE